MTMHKRLISVACAIAMICGLMAFVPVVRNDLSARAAEYYITRTKRAEQGVCVAKGDNLVFRDEYFYTGNGNEKAFLSGSSWVTYVMYHEDLGKVSFMIKGTSVYLPARDNTAPWGLKIVSGTGTSSDPFRFDLQMTDPYAVEDELPVVANNTGTQSTHYDIADHRRLDARFPCSDITKIDFFVESMQSEDTSTPSMIKAAVGSSSKEIQCTNGVHRYTFNCGQVENAESAGVDLYGNSVLRGIRIYYTGHDIESDLLGDDHVPLFDLPDGKTFTYDAQEHGLINAISASRFNTYVSAPTVQYSLDNESWSSDVPQQKSAGEYKVYYRVKYSDYSYNVHTYEPIVLPEYLTSKINDIDPMYTVTIPAQVKLGDTAEIGLSDVFLPERYSQINIVLDSTSEEDNSFKLRNKNDSVIEYKITKDDTEVSVGDKLLSVSEGSGTAQLQFSEPVGKVSYAGSYTGTVTFSIAAE